MCRSLFRVVLLFIFLVTIGAAYTSDIKIIIIGESKDIKSAKLLEEKAYKKILSDPILSKMNISREKMPRIFNELDDYIVVFGPFKSSDQLKIIFKEIKKLFPNAIIFSLSLSSSIKKEIVYKTIDSNVKEEDWGLWIGMFSLAIVGIFGLFLSSLQIRRIIKQNRVIRQRQEEMERRQHELFSHMGENIYSMSKDVIKNTKKAISDIGDEEAPQELKEVVKTENRILDTTNNLLEFLKIKAKKIHIEHKKFKINNMLDEMVSYFIGKYPNKDVELVLDINKALPIYAIGDFNNTVNILRNLVAHQFDLMIEGVVVLSISVHKTYEETFEMHIKITPYGKIKEENIIGENYFIPNIINEEGVDDAKNRINLFVAYELVSLMKGDITADRLSKGGAIIDLTIPIEIVQENSRKYRLPSKKYTQKKVYIVNHYYQVSLAQSKLFEYFKHKVTIDTEEYFLHEKPNLSEYDIVLIDNRINYQGFDNYIQMLKDKYNVKTVCMYNILNGISNNLNTDMFSKCIMKPLNQEHVFLLIKNLYSKEIQKDIRDNDSNKKYIRDFITNIEEKHNIDIDALSTFAGSRVLIVEDNEINQKMISTILDKAGIYSDIASNGEEAIDKIRENGANYYDLVLMDINMPIMDGFTATKKIRAIEGTERLPIVSLTALVLEHEIEMMKEVGIDAFLPKPINVGKIYTIFELFLEKNKKDKHFQKSTEETLDREELDGLDIEVGLKMSGDNPIFYKEILKEFLDVYGESGKVAKTLYEQQRLEAIKQLALDIMGLAGSIGAKDLYRAANEIYKLYLYNKLSLLPGFLKKYNEEIEKVKRSIEKYLQS